MNSSSYSSDISSEPFFIIGSARSGTTMLRLMLNDHPRLRIPRETAFLPQLIGQFSPNLPLSEDDQRLAFELVSNHWKWEIWATNPERLRDTISSLQQPLLCQLIDSIYRNCSNPKNKPRWGDKTLSCTEKVEHMHQVFPNAKFIHVIRDARDVCLSIHNAYLQDTNSSWRKNGQNISDAANFWCRRVDFGIKARRKLDSDLYLEIKYEDLVLKTEETLEKICTFIGEKYDSRMLNFYKNGAIEEMDTSKPQNNQYHKKTLRPPKPSDVYRWRKEMSLVNIALVEAIAGKTMDQVGQIRYFQGWLIFIPYILKFLNKLKRTFLLTNKDYELVTLPNSLHFLYYLLRPIRLFRRYILIVWKRILSN